MASALGCFRFIRSFGNPKTQAVIAKAEIFSWDKSIEDIKTRTMKKFIDTTVISYKGVKKQMMAVMEPTGDFSIYHALDAMDRQFGVRSAENLVKILKAYRYLKACKTGDLSV